MSTVAPELEFAGLMGHSVAVTGESPTGQRRLAGECDSLSWAREHAAKQANGKIYKRVRGTNRWREVT